MGDVGPDLDFTLCPIDSTSALCVHHINNYLYSFLSHEINSCTNAESAVQADSECILAYIALAHSRWMLGYSSAKKALNEARKLYNTPSTRLIKNTLNKLSSSSDIIQQWYDCRTRVRLFLSGFELILINQNFWDASRLFQAALEFLSPLDKNSQRIDLWAFKMIETVLFGSGMVECIAPTIRNLECIQKLSLYPFLETDSLTLHKKTSKPIIQYLDGLVCYALTQTGQQRDLDYAIYMTNLWRRKKKKNMFVQHVAKLDQKIQTTMMRVDPWMHHARFHALYRQGEYELLVYEALFEYYTDWDTCNAFLKHHLWWHLGLALLEMGFLFSSFDVLCKYIWAWNKNDTEIQMGSLSYLLRLLIVISEKKQWYNIKRQQESQYHTKISSASSSAHSSIPPQHLIELELLQDSVYSIITNIIHLMKQSNTLYSHWSGMFDGIITACLCLTNNRLDCQAIISQLLQQSNPSDIETLCDRPIPSKWEEVYKGDIQFLKNVPEYQWDTYSLWRKITCQCVSWATISKPYLINKNYLNQSIDMMSIEHAISIAERMISEYSRFTRLTASIEQADIFLQIVWNSFILYLMNDSIQQLHDDDLITNSLSNHFPESNDNVFRCSELFKRLSFISCANNKLRKSVTQSIRHELVSWRLSGQQHTTVFELNETYFIAINKRKPYPLFQLNQKDIKKYI